jgi:hypothetical protein
MGRKLAEATKACRTRRTRGETVLRFFRVATVWALPVAAVFLEAGLEAAVFLAGVCSAGSLFVGAGWAGVLSTGVVDWD